ncbi:MAG: hypothetical protein ACM3UU_12175 [Ignavibacteriales bacterium]
MIVYHQGIPIQATLQPFTLSAWASVDTNVFVGDRYMPKFSFEWFPSKLRVPFKVTVLDLINRKSLGKKAFEALREYFLNYFKNVFISYCKINKLVDDAIRLLPDSIVITEQDFENSSNRFEETVNFSKRCLEGKNESSVKEMKKFMQVGMRNPPIEDLLVYKFGEWYLPEWFDGNASVWGNPPKEPQKIVNAESVEKPQRRRNKSEQREYLKKQRRKQEIEDKRKKQKSKKHSK